MNFWRKMEKPIMCLAPMADVTDAAFRYIISKYSKKVSKGVFGLLQSQKMLFDTFVTYTEFVSADGLVLAPEKGKKKLLKNLEYSEIERPIVAQIFGSRPENMEQAVALIVKLGFDGVDINMGCPDKSIEKQGAGAALIKNPKLAREIIAAAKSGAKGEIPVSVKTRLGYNKDELETWLPELLAENPATIIIHARTRKEMSRALARWERIKRAVQIRDAMCKPQKEKVLIVGNGDVKDIDDAKRKCEETGADGAMLGRAVFGNPWLFTDHKPTSEERVKVLREHIKIFDEKISGFKNFAVMKKHFKAYLNIPELKKLKTELMKKTSAKEALRLLSDFRGPIL